MHHRKSTLYAYGLAALIFCTASDIHGQTPEDTVAFILFGLEDGAITPQFQPARWVNERPGLFTIQRPDPVMHFSVRAVSNCEYTLVISAPTDVRHRYLRDKMIVVTANFAKVSLIEPITPARRQVFGLPNALCEYLTGDNEPKTIFETYCTADKSEFPSLAEDQQIAVNTSPARVDAAVRFFQSTSTCRMLKF
jgi:hypothetical protein